jgi:hypothetical protein
MTADDPLATLWLFILLFVALHFIERARQAAAAAAFALLFLLLIFVPRC